MSEVGGVVVVVSDVGHRCRHIDNGGGEVVVVVVVTVVVVASLMEVVVWRVRVVWWWWKTEKVRMRDLAKILKCACVRVFV